MNKKITLLAVAFCLLFSTAIAQVSITNSTPYTQDFNTLPTSASSTANPSPANWWRYAATTTASTINVTAGSSNSGGFYSTGTGTNTDRSLGFLYSTNAKPLYAGVKFINNTGSAIVSATVSYKCEQWRRGNNNAGLIDTLMFEYTYVTDSINLGTWTSVPALAGSSSNTTAASPAIALDGNAVFKDISGTISDLAIPAGGTFWIRFNDLDLSPGSDDILSVDDFSISFTTGTISACVAPANSVTNVTLTSTGTESVSGSFTATSPASDAYLVLLSTSATAPVVADASTYSLNSIVDGATVISNGASTTFSRSGLTQATTYHIYVYPYNNTGCTGGPKYKTTTPGTAMATTAIDACPEPTAKPTNLVFKTVGDNAITGKFNKATPAPTGGYMVVYSTSSNVAYPFDSTVYVANDSISYSSFKSKVAYVGTDSNFSVLGLASGTKYYFAVIPFSTCGAFPNYLRTAPLRDDTTTTGLAPLQDCVQPSGVSNTSIVNVDSTTSTITIKWVKPATADSVMVLAGPTASIGFVTVRDSAFYAVGSTIPGSQATVYYRGADSTITLTGLQVNTVYKILIAAFNNRNCTNGPNYSSLANVLIRTASVVGGDCTQPTGVSNTSIIKLDSTNTTISIQWTNPVNADSVMVLAAPNATIGFVTVRDSASYAVGSTIPGSQAKVYYRGTGSNFVLTGLTSNTVYKIIVVAFNNKSCTNGPNYGGLGTTTVRTANTATAIKTKNVEAAFAIYPNPTNTGSLFVRFENRLKEDAVVEVIDILGQKLVAQKITSGNDLQVIDVTNFAKGTYILNVVYKGDNNVSTFIVQ